MKNTLTKFSEVGYLPILHLLRVELQEKLHRVTVPLVLI